jgi:Zn-dependent M28 family amino/carboxypeptidase
MIGELLSLEDRLRQHVHALARTPRVPGTREHRAAEDYIGNFLQAAGFLVEDFTDNLDGIPCTTLLTRPLPEGNELPLLVVGAHYDTVQNSPGADDNASAVAALLELGRWIRPWLDTSLGCRLQLVAYDLEEYGMVGSSLHANALHAAGAGVRGMISLEMLGYTDARPGSQRLPPGLIGMYPDVGNFIGVCGNEDSIDLLEAVTAALKGVEGLPVESITVPGKGEVFPQVRLSDHSSFWDVGFPALMITDTSFFRNPHYHQATDSPETLNYAFLARVTAGVGAAVRKMLE